MSDQLTLVSRSAADPLARIRADMATLTPAQMQVGRVFLDDPDWGIRASVEEIARLAGVSGPTVIRFCRVFGFDGLSDFKLRLAQSLAVGTRLLHRAISADDSVAAIVHKILHSAAAVLTDLESQLDVAAIDAAIAKIADARRVDCYSVGSTSTFLANDAQVRFSRLGLTSNAYFDAHAQLISAAALSPLDVALAISHVGRMPTLLEAVDVAREQGATVIGITQPNTPLAQRCSIPILVNVPEEATVRVGTEAYLAEQVLIEVLMVGVGLRLGPAALDRLKRIQATIKERGVDIHLHPALKWSWRKPEGNDADHG